MWYKPNSCGGVSGSSGDKPKNFLTGAELMKVGRCPSVVSGCVLRSKVSKSAMILIMSSVKTVVLGDRNVLSSA